MKFDEHAYIDFGTKIHILAYHLTGLSLHHPWRAADERRCLSAACCGADVESNSTQWKNPITAHSCHGGEPLPRDGPCHALNVRPNAISTRHRSGFVFHHVYSKLQD